MNITTKLLMASTIIGLAGTTAMAQGFETAQDAFDARVDQIDDQFDDLDDDVEDIEEGLAMPAAAGRELGFTGSIAASGSATTGNSETTNISIGTQMGFYDGVNGHNVRLTYLLEKDEGVETTNRVLAGYDYTRDFSDSFFGYANTAVAYDQLDELELDAYVSAGVGYRVFNTPTTQWSVQAGPAYRFTRREGGDETVREAAIFVGSDYYNMISDNLTVSNETDVLASEGDTYILNDVALTSRVSDQLALRTSLATEYHSDPAVGDEEIDNTFGVSVVYNFN